MKLKKILLAALLSPVLYFLGTYLESLYGLDPPYAFYFVGNTLILISYLMMVIIIALLMTLCYRFLRTGARTDKR